MKKQTNATDETLVALYAQGNNEAFDILLNRYKDRLYAYIYYTVRNEELAEDIFQETFTKAIVTIQQGRYNENGKFPAWLTRIAHNLIIDCFRQDQYFFGADALCHFKPETDGGEIWNSLDRKLKYFIQFNSRICPGIVVLHYARAVCLQNSYFL